MRCVWVSIPMEISGRLGVPPRIEMGDNPARIICKGLAILDAVSVESVTDAVID